MTFFTRCKRLIQNRKGLSIPELLIAITISGVIVGTAGQIVPSLILSTDHVKVTLNGQAIASNKWNEVYMKDFAAVTSEARTTVDPKLKLDRQVVVTTTDLGSGLTKKDIDVRVYKTGTNELVYNLPMVKTTNANGVPEHSHPPTEILKDRNNTAYDMGVSTELRWRYYGNGHTVVDASKGDLPGGSVNAQNPWTTNYPTLVGYNGTATYGVRVDSARVSDSANQLTGLAPSTAATGNTIATRDGSGYLTANYFRDMNATYNDSAAATAYYFSTGNGYLYKKSLAAVKAEIGGGGAAHSFGTSGYWKSADGLIIQWGKSSVGWEDRVNRSWPTPFPNGVIYAVHKDSPTGHFNYDGGDMAQISKTGFQHRNNHPDSYTQTMYYLVIGY